MPNCNGLPCDNAHKVLLGVLNPINFLLSLMIVFHHAFTVNVDYNGSLLLQAYGWTIGIQRFMYNLSECAVPMFYFLSAFLFYRTFDGSWIQYKEKIRRRFFSLFIPYVIFCTFGYVKHLSVIGLGGGNFTGYIYSLWVCDTMPLWFIRELMALSLLAPILWRLIQRPFLVLLLSIILIFLITIGIIPYRSFLYWIPIYIMGAMLDKKILSKLYILMENRVGLCCSIVICVMYIIWAWLLPNGISRADMTWVQNMDFIMFRIATPLVFLPLSWILFRYHIRDRRFMKYSFFVYCMHFPVITILGIVLDRLMGMAWYFEMIKYTIIIVLTYTICVLMAMMMQKYTPSLWYILNGHRE